MKRRKSTTRVLVLLAVSFLLACSDDTNSDLLDGAPGVDVLFSDSGLDSSHDTSPDTVPDAGRSQACLDQDTKLQAALDTVRKSPNAMLAVSNTACGTTVYVSGDTSTGNALSLWRVGSVTKTYLAATILAMVHHGKLALTDPLSKWVPNVPSTTGVTVKMLLNHSSGIFNYTDDPGFNQSPSKIWTPAEMVALATKNAPYFAPGTGWHYSNTNYALLGMIAEKAGGAKAGALIRKHALEPAGLKQTFLDGEEPLQAALANGFDKNKQDVTTLFNMSGPWVAGAMATTGADLCDWIRKLFGTTDVLTAGGLQTMLGSPITAGAKMKYGLGVMILDASVTAGGGEATGHNGDIIGFHTQAYWFADKKTAICSVVNQNGISVNDVTLAALKVLFK